MKTYPAGLVVRVTLPLIDFNGDPVKPTTLAYSVSDLDDLVLVPTTNHDFAANDTDADVTVQAVFNQLAAGEFSGGRIVRLFIGSAAGVHVQELVYGLRGYRRLVPPVNSFMTDAAAQVLAGDIPGLEDFIAAEATLRQAALIEAHTRIARIPLSPDATTHCRDVYDRQSWPDVTPAQFRLLPGAFKRALYRAQLIEANNLITGGGEDSRRANGVLSETIGDSSITFAAGSSASARTGLGSKAALSELAGYIVRSATLVRS